MIFVSDSAEKTARFAADLARTLSGGTVIALYGDLGAGKTAFTKGLARGLGVTDTVTSPTYIIMNEYAGRELTLLHYDMYRLNAEEARQIGISDSFGRTDAVCAVEWAENVAALLPPNAVSVTISAEDGGRRRIEVL